MFQAAKSIFEKITALRLLISQKLQLGMDVNSTTATGISIATPVTVLTSATSETRTLADGYPGQVKIFFVMTYGGAIVVTPTNLYNGNTISFSAVNQAWIGIFYAGQWHTLVTGGSIA